MFANLRSWRYFRTLRLKRGIGLLISLLQAVTSSRCTLFSGVVWNGLSFDRTGARHSQSQSLQGLPGVGGPIGHFQAFHNAVHLMGVFE